MRAHKFRHVWRPSTECSCHLHSSPAAVVASCCCSSWSLSAACWSALLFLCLLLFLTAPPFKGTPPLSRSLPPMGIAQLRGRALQKRGVGRVQ